MSNNTRTKPNLLLELFLQTLVMKTPSQIESILIDTDSIQYLNSLSKNGIMIQDIISECIPQQVFAFELETKLVKLIEDLGVRITDPEHITGNELVTTFHDQDIYEDTYSDEFYDLQNLYQSLKNHFDV